MIIDVECRHCEEGKIWRSRYGGNDPDVWPEKCPYCEGTGVMQEDLNDEIDDWGDDAETPELEAARNRRDIADAVTNWLPADKSNTEDNTK